MSSEQRCLSLNAAMEQLNLRSNLFIQSGVLIIPTC